MLPECTKISKIPVPTAIYLAIFKVLRKFAAGSDGVVSFPPIRLQIYIV